MNKYRIEITYEHTAQTKHIDAESFEDVWTILSRAGLSGVYHIKVEEVKKYRVMWIEHHSWDGYATDCDDAEQRALEYADTHNTFDDYGGFDTEEIEEDVPKIEVSDVIIKQNLWMMGAYTELE